MDTDELFRWRDNYILQTVEEEVVNELCFDKKTGAKKKVSFKVIREETLRRIKEREEDNA